MPERQGSSHRCGVVNGDGSIPAASCWLPAGHGGLHETGPEAAVKWDPIACGDDCVLSPPPVHVIDLLSDDGTRRRLYSPPEATPHKVTAPYVRTGSGYACAGCVS